MVRSSFTIKLVVGSRMSVVLAELVSLQGASIILKNAVIDNDRSLLIQSIEFGLSEVVSMVPACINEIITHRDIFFLKKEINLTDSKEDSKTNICQEIVVNKETDDNDYIIIDNNKNKYESEEYELFDIHKDYDYIDLEFTQKKSGSVEVLDLNIEKGLKNPIGKILEECAETDFKNHNYNVFVEIDYNFLFNEEKNESWDFEEIKGNRYDTRDKLNEAGDEMIKSSKNYLPGIQYYMLKKKIMQIILFVGILVVYLYNK